jgi:peptidoglycan hydrolase-like protein with peptidoglycan-binding domain
MFTMRTFKLYRVLMGILCLVLWSGVIAAAWDWRIGQAQKWLKAAGFNPGPVDGVLGPRTKEALRRYQAGQGLPATGELDEATRQALMRRDFSQAAGDAGQESLLKAPPGGEYVKLSSLAQLPDYFPGLGTLYVNPMTLPEGPYLAYDSRGNLVSSVYMIPLKDFRAGKAFNRLTAVKAKTDHVDIYYNNGHPGAPDAHYHIVLWYVSPEAAAAVK